MTANSAKRQKLIQKLRKRTNEKSFGFLALHANRETLGVLLLDSLLFYRRINRDAQRITRMGVIRFSLRLDGFNKIHLKIPFQCIEV